MMAKISLSNNVMTLEGELVFSTAKKLLKTGSACLDKVSGDVVINMAGVNNSNSAGLALMIGWLRYAKQRNFPLTFQAVPEQLLHMAEITGVKDVLGL